MIHIKVTSNYQYDFFILFLGASTYTNANEFGQGTGPILMSSVGCSGKEFNLFDCSYQPFPYSSCTHYYDAGVKCEGEIDYHNNQQGITDIIYMIIIFLPDMHKQSLYYFVPHVLYVCLFSLFYCIVV